MMQCNSHTSYWLLYIPGHADEIMGKEDLHRSASVIWLSLYLAMNSLQDSTRVKSLLQLVSNMAFTPMDLKNVVSFWKTWKMGNNLWLETIAPKNTYVSIVCGKTISRMMRQ